MVVDTRDIQFTLLPERVAHQLFDKQKIWRINDDIFSRGF